MGVYDRPIATAKRLIDKYGQQVTWRSIGSGTLLDPTKPWKGKTAVGTLQDYQVKIAFFNVSHVDAENQHMMNQGKLPNSSRVTVNSYSDFGFSVQNVGNTLAYMAQVNFQPGFNDLVLRNGKEHRVVNINNIDPGGPVVLYIVELEM